MTNCLWQEQIKQLIELSEITSYILENQKRLSITKKELLIYILYQTKKIFNITNATNKDIFHLLSTKTHPDTVDHCDYNEQIKKKLEELLKIINNLKSGYKNFSETSTETDKIIEKIKEIKKKLDFEFTYLWFEFSKNSISHELTKEEVEKRTIIMEFIQNNYKKIGEDYLPYDWFVLYKKYYHEILGYMIFDNKYDKIFFEPKTDPEFSQTISKYYIKWKPKYIKTYIEAISLLQYLEKIDKTYLENIKKKYPLINNNEEIKIKYKIISKWEWIWKYFIIVRTISFPTLQIKSKFWFLNAIIEYNKNKNKNKNKKQKQQTNPKQTNRYYSPQNTSIIKKTLKEFIENWKLSKIIIPDIEASIAQLQNKWYQIISIERTQAFTSNYTLHPIIFNKEKRKKTDYLIYLKKFIINFLFNKLNEFNILWYEYIKDLLEWFFIKNYYNTLCTKKKLKNEIIKIESIWITFKIQTIKIEIKKWNEVSEVKFPYIKLIWIRINTQEGNSIIID